MCVGDEAGRSGGTQRFDSDEAGRSGGTQRFDSDEAGRSGGTQLFDSDEAGRSGGPRICVGDKAGPSRAARICVGRRLRAISQRSPRLVASRRGQSGTNDSPDSELNARAPGAIAATLAALYRRGRDIPSVHMKRGLWARLLTTALGTQCKDDDELFIEHSLPVNSAEIHGVVEMDFFDWVLEVPGGEAFIRTLSRRLGRFDWSAVEHDVLKVLYESISLGEPGRYSHRKPAMARVPAPVEDVAGRIPCDERSAPALARRQGRGARANPVCAQRDIRCTKSSPRGAKRRRPAAALALRTTGFTAQRRQVREHLATSKAGTSIEALVEQLLKDPGQTLTGKRRPTY